MSDVPLSSPYRSTPDAAVTDAHRDQLSARLNLAFQDGSLDHEDYQQRLDRLFSAHRMAELVPVVQGLPPLQTFETPTMVESPGGVPGELARTRSATALTLLAVGALVGVVLLVALALLLAV